MITNKKCLHYKPLFICKTPPENEAYNTLSDQMEVVGYCCDLNDKSNNHINCDSCRDCKIA